MCSVMVYVFLTCVVVFVVIACAVLCVLFVFQNDVVRGVMYAFVCKVFHVVVCLGCELLCVVVWSVCWCVFVVFGFLYLFACAVCGLLCDGACFVSM